MTDNFKPYEARVNWMLLLGPVHIGVIEISRFAGHRQILNQNRCLLTFELAHDGWRVGLMRKQAVPA